jgi:two-component system response regulator HydG
MNTIPNWISKRLLIIEDTPIISKYFRYILSRTEIKIISCSTGMDGLGKLGSDAFDAVLTDIQLPDMDGLDLIREIKEKYPETPVIVQTAYCMESDIKRILATGCNDYLRKPVKQDDLHTALRKVFNE